MKTIFNLLSIDNKKSKNTFMMIIKLFILFMIFVFASFSINSTRAEAYVNKKGNNGYIP